MRLYKFAFVLMFFSFHLALGQNWVWLSKIGIGNYSDKVIIVSSTTDNEGNTYVLGNYSGKIILGDSQYVAPPFFNNNSFIAKYNTQGSVLWSSAFYASRFDEHYSIHKIYVDKDQRVYVSGSFNESVNFGNNIKLSIPPSYDIYDKIWPNFICAYNSGGIPQWAKFGDVLAISEDGKIYTESKLHDGFATYAQWKNFVLYDISRIISDSLYCYLSDSQVEFKSKTQWGYWSKDPSTTKYVSVEQQLWIFQQATTDLKILRFKRDQKQYDDLLIPNVADFESVEIYNDALYLLGWFPPNGDGKLQFGDITLQSPAKGYEEKGGFFTKYDLLSGKFEWVKFIKNMAFGFNNFLVSGNDLLYFTTESCCGSRNDLTCYSTKGDSLWTRNFYTSGFNIGEYTGIGTDKNGGVYAVGNVSNGVNNTATFGNLSFRYDDMVGFIAKIGYLPPTQPQYFVGQAISTSSIKLTWVDSNNEIGYRIDYKQEGEMEYTTLVSVPANSTQYVVTNLVCDKMYSLRIIAIGGNGFSDYSTELSLKPLGIPTPKVTTSASQACIGKEVKLSAPKGFAEYIWNTGETTEDISVRASGEYAVRVKDNANCNSNFSEKSKITFYAYPDTTISVTHNSIVYLGTADSYIWYRNGLLVKGETTNKITPTESGIFNIEVSSNGCISTSRNVTFIITGLEPVFETPLEVYPIPASNSVTIQFGNDQTTFEGMVCLLDLYGKKLLEYKGTNTLTLDTSSVNPGTYVLQINLNGQFHYRKLVIE